jgi:hypothetical protein
MIIVRRNEDVRRTATMVCVVLMLCGLALAQQSKNSVTVTGRFDGTAKNTAGEVITVSLELTEKEGALSGMIRSSHGDFTITGGSHKGDDVTLDFTTDGPTGTISLKLAEDKLSGTWSAGDDGGTIEATRVKAAEGEKGKS